MGVLLDNYTDTNGVLLENHTADVGGAWTKHTSYATLGQITIDSNQAYYSGTGVSVYWSAATPASADYSMWGKLVATSNLSTADASLCVRVNTAANTMYQGAYTQGTGWRIRKVLNGTFSQVGSTAAQTLTVGQSYKVQIIVSGGSPTSLELKVDGVSKCSGTDSSSPITAAGKWGVKVNLGSTTTGYHWDVVSDTDPDAGAGSFLTRNFWWGNY